MTYPTIGLLFEYSAVSSQVFDYLIIQLIKWHISAAQNWIKLV